MNNFFQEDIQVAIKALDVTFIASSFLVKTESNRIELSKINVIFNIVKILNNEGRALYKNVQNMKSNGYWSDRESLKNNLNLLFKKIKVQIAPFFNEVGSDLNIIELLDKLNKLLTFKYDFFPLKLLEDISFLKIPFFSGTSNSHLHFEDIPYLLNTLEHNIINVLDLIFIKQYRENSNEKMFLKWWKLSQKILDQVNKSARITVEIVKIDGIIDSLSHFFPHINNANIRNSIIKFKQNFLTYGSNVFKVEDLTLLISHFEEVLAKIYFNEIVFNNNHRLLTSKHLIQKDKTNILLGPTKKSRRYFSNKRLNTLMKSFIEDANTFRFYNTSNQFITYTNGVTRNAVGFNILSIFKHLIKKVYTIYGTYNEQTGYTELEKEDLVLFFADNERILREFNIFPIKVNLLINKIFSTGDLFQFQSNGDSTLNVNELTESVANFISSKKLSDRIIQVYEENKLCAKENILGIYHYKLSCFREHIFNTMFEKLKFQKQFVKFNEYINSTNTNEVLNHLENIDIYARTESINRDYISFDEIFSFIVILANIETAFINNDINNDNIIDSNELSNVYLVFKNLLSSLIKAQHPYLSEWIKDNEVNPNKSFNKSLFYYLVMKHEIPGPFALSYFHFTANDYVGMDASRLNISSIFVIVSDLERKERFPDTEN